MRSSDSDRRAFVIYAVTKLGIADLLLEGPKTAAELAHLSDTHPKSLRRLMHGLVILDTCKEASDGTLPANGYGDTSRGRVGAPLLSLLREASFESVLRGADAIVLKSIIHDWNDERCKRILRDCHGA